MNKIGRLARRTAAALGLALAAGAAHAGDTVGNTFPSGFNVPLDASLGEPVIGFGGAGPVKRTPVIFLHGNGGAPYGGYTPDGREICSYFSADIQGMAQYFADNGGYRASELWALGYLGTVCEFDNGKEVPAYNASQAHTITANVPDLRAFVDAVMAYTGASKVDIVAHGMGVILAREWMRQDRAVKLVRKLVAIEGPNQGMIICSAHSENPWKLAFSGGFTPDSPVCQELGSPNTEFLRGLNTVVDGGRGKGKGTQAIPSTLVIRNGDRSFLFMPVPDGLVPAMPTPVVDSYDYPADFTDSASMSALQGTSAEEMTLKGQSKWDPLGTAHVGIANSPAAREAALEFLKRK